MNMPTIIRGRQIFFRGGGQPFQGGGKFVDPIFNEHFFSKKINSKNKFKKIKNKNKFVFF
jgi:hypothetical protein